MKIKEQGLQEVKAQVEDILQQAQKRFDRVKEQDDPSKAEKMRRKVRKYVGDSLHVVADDYEVGRL